MIILKLIKEDLGHKADFALFTADITKPFEIISNTKNLVDQFDIYFI